MNVQWRPYGWNQPGAEELPPLRKNANFVGVLMLALVGASMTLPSGLLMLLQVLGAADLAQVNYGLDKMGYLFFQTAAYLLYLALPAIVVALIMRRDLRPFPSRRVQPSVLIPAVMVGLGLMVLANLVASILMNILSAFGLPRPTSIDTMDTTVLSLVLNLVSTAVLPALVEEMVFRGYILGGLRPQGDGLAIVFSAVFFGLLHGNLLQIPFAFILGLIFGYLTVQTGSIWPAVLLHFLNNAFSVVLQYAAQFLPDLDSIGMLNGAAFTVMAVLGVIGAAVLWAGHRPGDTAPQAVLRPVGNGFSALSVPRRVGQILLSPTVILSLAGLLAITALNVVSSIVGQPS